MHSDIYKNILIKAFENFLTLIKKENLHININLSYKLRQEAKIRQKIKHCIKPTQTLEETEVARNNKIIELQAIKYEMKMLKKQISQDIINKLDNDLIITKQQAYDKLDKKLKNIRSHVHKLKHDKFYYDNEKAIIKLQKDFNV